MKKYYAYRVGANGQLIRLKPAGRLFFDAATVSWLRLRAKRGGYRIVVKTVASSKRDLMVAFARWALANERAWHYRQSRPIPLRAAKAHRVPLYTDCSGFVTMAFYAAGLPDPNRQGYNGLGYTGTLRARGRRISLRSAKPGDYIVYGGGNGRHVVLVMKSGADPLVASHGQENGPRLYRHSQQAAYHGMYTCHSAGA